VLVINCSDSANVETGDVTAHDLGEIYRMLRAMYDANVIAGHSSMHDHVVQCLSSLKEERTKSISDLIPV